MGSFKADNVIKRVLLIAAVIVLVHQSAAAQSAQVELTASCRALAESENGGRYLRDFFVRLPAATPGRDIPVVKENMRLMPNFTYRITLCTPEDEESGIPVVEIYDGRRKVFSSYDENTGRHFSSVDFVCTRNSVYTFWFYFLDGKQGTASAMITHFVTRR